jgi:biopolymer transport protein ExbB
MAETKPTVTAASKSSTSVQPVKKSNSISWIAPVLCLIIGYIIWRFIIGNPDNFERPDPSGGFWPSNQGPKTALSECILGVLLYQYLLVVF